MATWFVDELVRRSPLWAGVSRAAAIDTVWALMDAALFWRLIIAPRWTNGRFRLWFADSVVRLLLPANDGPAASVSGRAGA
jgi:hypothetical protein